METRRSVAGQIYDSAITRFRASQYVLVVKCNSIFVYSLAERWLFECASVLGGRLVCPVWLFPRTTYDSMADARTTSVCAYHGNTYKGELDTTDYLTVQAGSNLLGREAIQDLGRRWNSGFGSI